MHPHNFIFLLCISKAKTASWKISEDVSCKLRWKMETEQFSTWIWSNIKIVFFFRLRSSIFVCLGIQIHIFILIVLIIFSIQFIVLFFQCLFIIVSIFWDYFPLYCCVICEFLPRGINKGTSYLFPSYLDSALQQYIFISSHFRHSVKRKEALLVLNHRYRSCRMFDSLLCFASSSWTTCWTRDRRSWTLWSSSPSMTLCWSAGSVAGRSEREN